MCVLFLAYSMTVLGFGGPLDSESYMPSGVSLKVVDLIGCIRVCVCVVCVSICVCFSDHVCGCMCALACTMVCVHAS